jgi:hypothetical protein
MAIKKLLKKLPGVPQLYSFYRRIRSLQSIDVDSLHQQMQQILINQYKMIHASGSTPVRADIRCRIQMLFSV